MLCIFIVAIVSMLSVSCFQYLHQLQGHSILPWQKQVKSVCCCFLMFCVPPFQPWLLHTTLLLLRHPPLAREEDTEQGESPVCIGVTILAFLSVPKKMAKLGLVLTILVLKAFNLLRKTKFIKQATKSLACRLQSKANCHHLNLPKENPTKLTHTHYIYIYMGTES